MTPPWVNRARKYFGVNPVVVWMLNALARANFAESG
jgi:hypothetical protein